ncbi:ABC transporter permease [Enemella dayhoffiae]|uniref:ABC transporter permease n=2 Tax=Enemella dayhoffiae TaxID=2016507 RepID=A0A255H4W2_9ACTN|nr:ABC transporter permease [Enemella dayhoffiae]
MSAARAMRFFGSELKLIIGRRRNQVGLVVLASIPIILAIVLRVNRPRGSGGPDFLSEITNNGFFVAVTALSLEMTLFLPLAIATLSGDAIAGEASQGTLRYLLTVPVHRTRLLLTKYAALVVGAVVAPLTVAVAGVLIGGLLFGLGPVTVLSGAQLSLPAALLRLLGIVGYLAVGLAALAAVGLFISTLTEQPVAVTLATAGVAMISWILDSVPQLEWLHPWLLVHGWPAYADLLREPVFWDNLGRGLLVDLAWLVIFGTAAWARFGGRDVTS